MKVETFVKIVHGCAKGGCLSICPHREKGGKMCKNALLRDAVSLLTVREAKKND